MQILPVHIGQQAAAALRRLERASLVPPNLPRNPVHHRNGHYDFGIPSVKYLHGFSGWLWSNQFKEFVSGHPLEDLILRPIDQLIKVHELKGVLDHVDFDLSCTDAGAIPASTREDSRYSKYGWTRDMANKVLMMIELGDINNAKKVIYQLATFYNHPEQRNRLVSYHWHPQGDIAEPVIRFMRDFNGHPRIRGQIDGNGNLVQSNHPWAHNQFDAYGAWLYATFYLAHVLRDQSHPRFDPAHYEPNFLKDLDNYLSTQNPDNKLDSIFSVALRSLNRVRAWDNYDVGPWEDVYAHKRASSIGIILKAAKQIETYLGLTNWQCMTIDNPGGFYNELKNLMHHSGLAIEDRIPRDGREPTECQWFPSDAALTFLLYPYNPGLSREQELSILNSLYKHRMGEIGFTRRGRDIYYGQDYLYGHHSQGIYANEYVPDYRAAQWGIFDEYLSIFFANDVLATLFSRGTIDWDRLELAEFHLRRALAHVTPTRFEEDGQLWSDEYVERYYLNPEHDPWAKPEEGNFRTTTVKIPAKRLIEAVFYDSHAKKFAPYKGFGRWRANPNTPLLWNEAAFLTMIRKNIELKAMLEEILGLGIGTRYSTSSTSPAGIAVAA